MGGQFGVLPHLETDSIVTLLGCIPKISTQDGHSECGGQSGRRADVLQQRGEREGCWAVCHYDELSSFLLVSLSPQAMRGCP